MENAAKRFEMILGERGARAKVSRILGYSREHVGKVFNGHLPMPDTWVVVLEFLEKVPPDEWPDSVKSKLKPG